MKKLDILDTVGAAVQWLSFAYSQDAVNPVGNNAGIRACKQAKLLAVGGV